jgi:hypothetical protein
LPKEGLSQIMWNLKEGLSQIMWNLKYKEKETRISVGWTERKI